MTVSLSADAEARLRDKAAAAGETVDVFASRVLENVARGFVSLRELSGPLGEEFYRSGMTEDELTELLEQEKHALRAERRASKDRK
jgi:hypothetical protein